MSCHTSSRVGTLLNAKAFAESNNLLRKELNIFVDKKNLTIQKHNRNKTTSWHIKKSLICGSGKINYPVLRLRKYL